MRKILPLTSSFLEIKKGADSKYIHKKKKANAWFSQKKVKKMKKCKVLYIAQNQIKLSIF